MGRLYFVQKKKWKIKPSWGKERRKNPKPMWSVGLWQGGMGLSYVKGNEGSTQGVAQGLVAHGLFRGSTARAWKTSGTACLTRHGGDTAFGSVAMLQMPVQS